jgi:hypothetical protein
MLVYFLIGLLWPGLLFYWLLIIAPPRRTRIAQNAIGVAAHFSIGLLPARSFEQPPPLTIGFAPSRSLDLEPAPARRGRPSWREVPTPNSSIIPRWHPGRNRAPERFPPILRPPGWEQRRHRNEGGHRHGPGGK